MSKRVIGCMSECLQDPERWKRKKPVLVRKHSPKVAVAMARAKTTAVEDWFQRKYFGCPPLPGGVRIEE